MINGVKGENRLARHICIIAERARHVKGGCRGSRSFYPLHACEFLLLRQSVGKEYFKLRMNLAPIPASAGPFSCNVYLSQVEHFEQAVIVRKYRPVFWDLPQLPVKILNGIGGVDQRSYRLRILKIGWKFRSMSLPRSRNFRIFRVPFGRKLL